MALASNIPRSSFKGDDEVRDVADAAAGWPPAFGGAGPIKAMRQSGSFLLLQAGGVRPWASWS